jgi:acetyltransferase-like isoleucine patch superfamily enzyme
LIEQPFVCDYGYNIEIGENFYSNHNTIMLDGAKGVSAAGNLCTVIRKITEGDKTKYKRN